MRIQNPRTSPTFKDEVHPQFDSDILRLLNAVNEGDEYELQRLLDKGVDLQATNEYGETALHLAVINDRKSTVELLLKNGSDTEAADKSGSKPLYVAAELGNLASVKLLLRYKANVESFNEQSENSALHRTLLNGYTDVAEVLLENQANIDMPMTQNGQTLLFRAVADDNLHLAEFLLDNGANKHFCDNNGRTAEDLADEGTPMKGLLRSDRLLQGPSIEKRKTKPKAHFTVPVLPAGQVDKLNACRGFEGTVIDFFVEGTEQRIEKTVPVYDLLYGSGAESIMNSAKEKMESMVDRQRRFRWYHLPANNMEWVEILITRHFGERGSGSIVLSEKSKSKLALTNAMGHQYRASANLSSYMRPICQTVKDPPSETTKQIKPCYFAYRRMADFLKEEKERLAPEIQHEPANAYPTKRKGKKSKAPRPVIVRKVNPKPIEPAPVEETVEEAPSVYQLTRGRRTPLSPLRSLGGKIRLMSSHVVDALWLSLGRQEDLEKGERVTSTQDTTDNTATGSLQANHEEIETLQHIDPSGAREPRGSTRVNELEATNPAESIPVPRIHITQPSTQNTPGGSIDSPIQEPLESSPPTDDVSPAPVAGGQTQDSTMHSTIPEEATTRPDDSNQPPGATNIEANKPETTKARIPFDEHLVKGYLSVTNPTASPLQLRRTLDQYFYAHLSSTAERDSGQVVYRYTEKHFSEPKIIMVDQLWLWVLNEDTIISCFPQRWDVWANQPSPSEAAENVIAPPIEPTIFDPPPPPAAGIRVRRSPSHTQELVMTGRIKDKAKNEPSLLLEWMSGKISKPRVAMRDSHAGPQKKHSMVLEEPHLKPPSVSSSRSSSTIEKRRLESLKRDPLNALQMILGHLRVKTRDPFTSVYDLARVIADSCVGLFDPYHVPEEYQFFDFFERSIGVVIDQETRCFQHFATRLANTSTGLTASKEIFSISTETKLLVEIKDIIDELGILHMILTDQAKPVDELSKLVTDSKKIKNGSTNGENSSPVRNPVLENNLHRVEKMQRLANESYKALYNLLDLKQKQNNVSEALSARIQAENTSEQAKAANDLTERGLQQAKLARQQAAESIRQGRTVLVFTVVTIIFVRPLSQRPETRRN
ncbi:hypothetical protein FQN50_006594 [Emmonsiellopsis sp. PD_5]|nr:hypothetical protein FQN50_006594 [Emmonsiellopsis sp. PD_5]